MYNGNQHNEKCVFRATISRRRNRAKRYGYGCFVCVFEFNLGRRVNDGTEIFATISGIMPTAKAATLTVAQTHL